MLVENHSHQAVDVSIINTRYIIFHCLSCVINNESNSLFSNADS